MRPKCPVCGKLFWCDWPNLWRYKREKIYLCSWSCLRKYDERKEAGDMAYSKIKKDGTPAKIQNGKKKEEPKVELVYDPSIAEEYRAEQEAKKKEEDLAEENRPKIFREIDIVPLECAALFSRVVRYGRFSAYRSSFGKVETMGFTANDVSIEMPAKDWNRFSAEILLALAQLGIREEDPEDCTGNNGPL